MKNADHDDYARLRGLFERCADMAPGERDAWLERESVDTATRIELELLLAADANDAALLRGDVVDLIDRLDEPADEFDPGGLVGRRYGAFRLTRLVGRGGQGTVYEAERVEGDFAQKVAVKLLHRGIHDPHEHRRFRRERDILARLDDPGIARLIDGGVSAEGVPYLIMDFVDGAPFDRWCARHAPDTAARLAMFERLCTIVAAAHRALIVHRDLKPANVLVTTDGAVKVLDFGIARLLDEDDAQGCTAVPLMTPGYGAPEQLDGGPVTLATDVHALGVMLRQVLTGRAPNVPATRVDDGIVAHGDVMPAELEWIAARATDSEPGRRYRDAAALHDDIERYRSARPVHAHPPSTLYAARKFVRRHRGGVLATMLFLVGVLASAGVALWQAKVAHDHAQRAEATRDFLLGVFKSAQDGLAADAKPTPQALVDIAAKRLDSDDSLPAATRADFLSALADVARYSNDAAAALPLYERAIALQAGAPYSRERLRAEVLRAMTLSRLGRAAEAEAALRPRMDAVRAVADAIAVDGLWAWADALGELGRFDDYLHGMEEVRRVVANVPTLDPEKVLVIDSSYAIALYMVGRYVDSAAVYDSVLARWRAAKLPRQRDYAISLANLGALRNELGELDSAEALLREALDIDATLYGKAHPNTAVQKRMLGEVLAGRGKSEEAEAMLQAALAELGTHYGASHPQVISATVALAALDVQRQDHSAAVERLRGIIRICDGIADGSAAGECSEARAVLAEALLHSGRLDEAAVAAQEAARRRRELEGDTSPDSARPTRIHGEVLLAQGHADQALERFDLVARLYEGAGMHANIAIADLHVARARALHALGRGGEALDELDRATPMLASLVPVTGRRLRLLATRASILAALGRAEEARATARDARALAPARAAIDAAEWEALGVLAR